MTTLAILSTQERQKFDFPPKFNADDRALHFSLTNNILTAVQELRSPTTKVGFIIQLGYFKANGKFYTTEQFRQQDIDYIIHMLKLDPNKIDFSNYQKKILNDHQNRILELVGWKPFKKIQQEKIIEHVKWLVGQQISLKHIFLSIIDFCWQNKIELPSYSILSNIVTDSYNHFEHELLSIIQNKLTQAEIDLLNQLIGFNNEKTKLKMQRLQITLIKKINQSLSPTDIQGSVDAFKKFKEYFHKLKPIIDDLNLSDQATEYFATWVQKSTVFQLTQFPNKNKLYLHLLCYIKHQFYYRHDILIDMFLKSVQSSINAANKQLNQFEKKNRPERNKAIKTLSSSSKDSRGLIEKITEIVKSPILSESGKLSQIELLLDQYHTQHNASEKNCLVKLEKSLDEISKNQTFFDALESMSLKLQNRVSAITKTIEFNTTTSSNKLISAIDYFRTSDGDVGNTPPMEFLKKDETDILYVEKKLRVSLYKALLFVHMADAIRSGRINLTHSYRYRAIHEYLIDEDSWKIRRDELLANAGLEDFSNFNMKIDTLKQLLNSKYEIVNERFLKGENIHLKLDKTGKVKVSTPSIESSDTKYVPSLLSQSGFTPIIQVLSDINAVTHYTDSFKHFSVKHKKMHPKKETLFAGIIGKGCNIGVNKIANISVGISEDVLTNTVNWFFSLKNLQSANNKIIKMINKLSLSNFYRHNSEQLHTGSDGRKVGVSVDSILASYSFKYFGKDKGVSVYTFLDERQLLFHFTVISSSEREAAYVIDGLLQNEVVRSNIHSTDTHGFTETVFAATHFINTAFAPRIKNVEDQKIYSFSTKKTYEKLGYKILPSRVINLKLIENYWDDILRFMVTIKLKHTSASQLFKRLSSYAKDHPLYKALKEFGRIIKSIFILTYFDDVELRQRIEKQLNKGELSNKFSNAVFFDDDREFKQGEKEEQEISTACKILIQNAIVLWNYLYLSQLLANIVDLKERKCMFELIKRSSIIVWRHINMQGEYDFTRHAQNDLYFDMAKILGLQAA